MPKNKEPIDLIAAKGRKHLTKSEYEERKNSEIIAPSDNVNAPSFLSKNEKKRFDEIAKQLIELKIMTNLDCDVLARYIRAETEYIKISKQLTKIKFIPDKKSRLTANVQLEEQYSQYGYLSKIQTRTMKACNECAKELGLTISSRCKLVMPKSKEPEKPTNKFMKHA
jgi:phage terminase, small subunit, putative, P27 family